MITRSQRLGILSVNSILKLAAIHPSFVRPLLLREQLPWTCQLAHCCCASSHPPTCSQLPKAPTGPIATVAGDPSESAQCPPADREPAAGATTPRAGWDGAEAGQKGVESPRTADAMRARARRAPRRCRTLTANHEAVCSVQAAQRRRRRSRTRAGAGAPFRRRLRAARTGKDRATDVPAGPPGPRLCGRRRHKSPAGPPGSTAGHCTSDRRAAVHRHRARAALLMRQHRRAE